MAGKKAGFVTGANAKIMIDSKVIAYATNVGYDITVQTLPIEGIGRYEVWSNEPVSYTVTGSLTVIRYTERANDSGIDSTDNTAANGNAIDQVALDGSDRDLSEHLDPAQLLLSETFDLKIFEKTPGTDDNRVIEIKDCRLTRRSGNLDKRGVLMDNFAFVGIIAGDVNANNTGINAGNSGSTDLASS